MGRSGSKTGERRYLTRTSGIYYQGHSYNVNDNRNLAVLRCFLRVNTKIPFRGWLYCMVLCLPQIPFAGPGVAAHNGWNQMLDNASPGTIAEVREIHAAIGEQNQSCPVGRENPHTCPPYQFQRGLQGSVCAPLVTVVKTTHLRYGNDSSEFQHRPRFRASFASDRCARDS